jgi:HK97 gp10 family phage protein
MIEMKLGDFVKMLHAAVAEHRLHEAENEALDVAAKMICDEAKHVIGTYEYDWPKLAESTQAERERKGYPANEPLLRTGAMRDSISYTITEPGKKALIGSPSDIAVYQELGTSTIPARPFLMPSVIYCQHKAEAAMGAIIGAALTGNSIEDEILRLAREALHHAEHAAEEVLQPENESER